MSVEGKSMREQLEQAFAEDTEPEETGGPPEDSEEPVGDTEEETTEEAESEPGKEESETSEEEPPKDDKSGGAKKSEDPGKPAKTESAKSGDKPGGKKASVDIEKAPASWKPAAREHWNKIPKGAREEILKREKEIDLGLQKASGHRKIADEYASVIRPFEQLIRSQNSTPAQAITNMMHTASRLALGSKTQKAQVVAEIMKNYDVDVEALDTLLAGKTLPAEEDKITKILEKQLAPLREFVGEFQNTRRQSEQQTEGQIQQELETFAADPKNEFFNDVVDDMADIMELASNRGQKITLEAAYAKACGLHPDVSKVINQRQAAKKPNLGQKRHAASSIKGDPGEAPSSKKDGADMRQSLMESWDELESAR